VAGTTVPEIYCWEITADDLKIYLASTRKGALRIGLSLEIESGCGAFFEKVFPNAIVSMDFHLNRPLIEGVEAALVNRPLTKHLDIDLSFTRFQWLTLKAIEMIPFGETKTYGEIGSMLGKPGSARAVGQALKFNPLPLIFP
jgi:O6-methylguanine-DNA--protein-cysteine methyltransferase